MSGPSLKAVAGDGFTQSWLTRGGRESCVLKAEKALWRKLQFRDRQTGDVTTVQRIQCKLRGSKGRGGAAGEQTGAAGREKGNSLSVMFSRIRVLIESLWLQLHIPQQEQAAFAAAHYYPETIDNYNFMFKEIQRLYRRREASDALITTIDAREKGLARLGTLARHSKLTRLHQGVALSNVLDEAGLQVAHLRHLTCTAVAMLYRLRSAARMCYPFLWCGQNYALKMASDVAEELGGTPLGSLLQGAGIPLEGNPLLLGGDAAGRQGAAPVSKAAAHRYAACLEAMPVPATLQDGLPTRAATPVPQQQQQQQGKRRAASATPASGQNAASYASFPGPLKKLAALTPLKAAVCVPTVTSRGVLGFAATAPVLLATSRHQPPPRGCPDVRPDGSRRNKYRYPEHVYRVQQEDPRVAVARAVQEAMQPAPAVEPCLEMCGAVIHSEEALLRGSALQAVLLRRCHAAAVIRVWLRAHCEGLLPEEERARRRDCRDAGLKSCLPVFALAAAAPPSPSDSGMSDFGSDASL